ncbi:C40 family peptidase [Desulfitobacterium sp. Sab5]|uniref:C40 family peptidase n=1 Tax=Desulfitobacterium nosdiversum TaxID=3375356 RepID=UPI003CF82A53
MVLSSRRVWVGSAVLSSALLLSSLPGVHTPAQAAESTTGLKTVVLSSNPLSGYSASAVRNSIITTAGKVQVKVDKPNQKVQVVAATNSTKRSDSSQKTKQVASTAQTKQQISRSNDSAASSVIRNAMSLVGTPYSFGGTSRSGFDCSGYTQYVFKGSGISLPRTSYAQFGVGTAVTKSQLQPGDLVFFTTYSSGASHVGIYIGGGNFIHASNSGVRTTSLGESYYASHFVGARRVN